MHWKQANNNNFLPNKCFIVLKKSLEGDFKRKNTLAILHYFLIYGIKNCVTKLLVCNLLTSN